MNGIDRNVWYAMTAVLAVGLVAGLVWYVRQISLKRAAMPSAFLIALFIHAILGGGLFYVGLGEQIVEAVHKVHAALPSLENYAASTSFEAHEGYQATPQPFELVRDLAARESVATTELPQLPLPTIEMRVSPGTLKVELPVPREETAGKRVDEVPLAPSTPTAASPARTTVRAIEMPTLPDAPLENVPSLPSAVPGESRASSAPVEVARAPAMIDPLANSNPVAGAVPSGLAEKILPGDLRDDRSAVPLAPVSSAKPGVGLVRTSRPAFDDVAAPVDPLRPGVAPKSGGEIGKPDPSAVAINVGRQSAQLPGANLGLPTAVGASRSTASGGVAALSPANSGPVIGRPDPVPTFGGSGLPKRRNVDLGGAVADSNIGPEALLKARQNDNKLEAIEKRGGSKASQEAVTRGLTWLERHQFPDGRWSLHDFASRCKDHAKCTAEGNLPCDTAATALSILPFLGDGHTQRAGQYPDAVERALDWLITKQKRSGELTTGDEGKARLYGHGIAAIALCEAYAMSQDPRLREPAQRSLDFIVASQHLASGGWRYQPNEPADTSVVGWQIMALKSGQMARLSVPQRSFDLARKWLDSVEGQGSLRGRFGYQSREPTPSMTAEGLLCRQYLGASRDDPSLLAGAEYLLANLPHRQQENSYYWYYGTQTMYHLQGHYWQNWNKALRDMLVAAQIKQGPMAGTWDPVDRGEVTGGRVFSTSIRVLMLEVYYRHLPLYQALEE